MNFCDFYSIFMIILVLNFELSPFELCSLSWVRVLATLPKHIPPLHDAHIKKMLYFLHFEVFTSFQLIKKLNQPYSYNFFIILVRVIEYVIIWINETSIFYYIELNHIFPLNVNIYNFHLILWINLTRSL